MFIFSVLNFPVADDQTLDNSAPNEWEVSDWLGEVAVGARGALAPVPSALLVHIIPCVVNQLRCLNEWFGETEPCNSAFLLEK